MAEPLPSEPDASQLDVPLALAGSGWYRTPSGGWAGAPVSPLAIPQHALPAILAAAGGQVHGIQRPFTISQQGCPPVEYQDVDHLAPSPTRLAQLSPAIGIDSPRSGTIHSPSSSSLISHDRPHLSSLLLIPFRPSRGGSGQPPDSQGGDGFPSQSLKVKPILPKQSSANRGSALNRGSKCQVQSPHVGSSKLESGPTPSEKSRSAMSVTN